MFSWQFHYILLSQPDYKAIIIINKRIYAFLIKINYVHVVKLRGNWTRSVQNILI